MSNLFNVGAAITLHDNVSPALAVISKMMFGMHGTIGQLTQGFANLRMGIIGAFAAFTGGEILHGLNKLTNASKDLLHQQELMRLQGWRQKEAVDALNASYKISMEVPTTTVAENLKHLRELGYATGKMPEAIAILPDIARANAVLNAMKGGGKDEVWNLAKGLEEKGVLNIHDAESMATFRSYVSNMTKAVAAAGGKVTPAMFQGAFLYSRTALFGLSEEFITEVLPRLIQSMSTGAGGGASGGAGTPIMSLFTKLVQGQMSKKGAGVLKDLGLLDEHTDIEGSASSIVKVKGRNLAVENPYEWVQQYLWPALQAKGIADPKRVSETIAKIGEAFQVRTASALATIMALQGRARLGDESPIEKDRQLKRMAMPFDFMVRSLMGERFSKGHYRWWKTGDDAGDPETVMTSYHAQIEAMESTIGLPMLKMKLEFMKALLPLFQAVTTWASVHPEAIQMIAKGLLALGAALVVFGTILVGGAIISAIGAIAALPAAAILAVAAAIAAVALAFSGGLHVDWKHIGESIGYGLVHLPVYLIGAIDGMCTGIARGLIAGIRTIPRQIYSGIRDLGEGFAQGFLNENMALAGEIVKHMPSWFASDVPSGAKVPPIDVSVTIPLDGKVLARVVTSIQADEARYPGSAGGPDTYGNYYSPGLATAP